jgi:hypothetical protein
MAMIYRYPGAMITLEDGNKYDFKVVDDGADIGSGWHLTYWDARDSYDAAKHINDDYMPPIEDDAPVTRDELEAKAKELGVGYNSRTTDETLLERINEKLSQ